MPDSIELKPVGRSAPKPPPRHPDTAPGGLGQAYRATEEKVKMASHLQEGGLDAVSTWGLGAAAWFSILALPLLIYPRMLIFFSQTPPQTSQFATSSHVELDRDHYDALTPLESFLCLSLGLGLVAMALITVFVLVPTYLAPLSTTTVDTTSGVSPESIPTKSPGRVALLAVLVGLTSLMSVLSWNSSSVGALGKAVSLGNGAVGIWGWWVIIFGGGRGLLSKAGKKSKVPERLKRL